MQFTVDDSYTIQAKAAGDPRNPLLLLVHGWYSFHGVWQTTWEALQDRYYCVAVDLLGFGQSDKPTEADYGIEAQARRLLQIADSLKAERFMVMGHSMGGQIALALAAKVAPERVSRLVSIGGVVSGKLSRWVRYVNTAQVNMGRWIPFLYTPTRWMTRFRPYAYLQFRAWFYDMQCLPFEMWQPHRLASLQNDLYISGYQAGKAILNCDLTPDLGAVQAPTLVIFGKEDGTVPVSEGHLIEQHVPDSRLVVFDECGHYPMYEKPDVYFQIVKDWLP